MEEQKPAEPEDTHRRSRPSPRQKKGEVILREHEYDGIQEFDQKLPNWWLFTLYIAIAWSVVHWFLYYHTGTLPNRAERMAEWKAHNRRRQRPPNSTKSSKPSTTMPLVNTGAPTRTSSPPVSPTYSTFCVACHAPDLSATLAGAPLPGLPLTDWRVEVRQQTHGHLQAHQRGLTPESEATTGQNDPLGSALGPKKVAEVTAFVISHKTGQPNSPSQIHPSCGGASAPSNGAPSTN